MSPEEAVLRRQTRTFLTTVPDEYRQRAMTWFLEGRPLTFSTLITDWGTRCLVGAALPWDCTSSRAYREYLNMLRQIRGHRSSNRIHCSEVQFAFDDAARTLGLTRTRAIVVSVIKELIAEHAAQEQEQKQEQEPVPA